jgi:hypothetical protein
MQAISEEAAAQMEEKDAACRAMENTACVREAQVGALQANEKRLKGDFQCVYEDALALKAERAQLHSLLQVLPLLAFYFASDQPLFFRMYLCSV